jgi:aspartyl-tRNA(Asn)/glutamyl-tRNA(Gln) amidotransferase subunit B
LPQAKKSRFCSQYGLAPYDAAVLTGSRELAQYYENVVAALEPDKDTAKLAANWMMGELSAALNRNELDVTNSPIPALQLAALLKRVKDGTISGKGAKEAFDDLWERATNSKTVVADFDTAISLVDKTIAARGLQQISDSGAIEKIVDDVLAANPQIVAEYKAGKEKAFNSLVGQAMKATKGKANPAQVNEILKRRLG